MKAQTKSALGGGDQKTVACSVNVRHSLCSTGDSLPKKEPKYVLKAVNAAITWEYSVDKSLGLTLNPDMTIARFDETRFRVLGLRVGDQIIGISGIIVKNNSELEAVLRTRNSGRLVLQARRWVKANEGVESDRMDLESEVRGVYGIGNCMVVHCVTNEMQGHLC
ncbi:hypothetical protein QR680_004529 [Steinernema hermaphroditum]|uniref:PDZ domain-containing protein n=1 Tax=Steinernema hermaphroditum TaxID=289476 RepID=A0AA39LU52_9BILA|nr:hypothetical protein QR680_004529 [Steinernema hermaphroditum]